MSDSDYPWDLLKINDSDYWRFIEYLLMMNDSDYCEMDDSNYCEMSNQDYP
jgi:hypothetical protein